MNVFKILLRYRRPLILLHFAVVLAMLPGIFQLENENSPEVFFVQDADALHHYRCFRRDFGEGEALRVALSGPELWTFQGLTWIGELEKHMALLPGVETAVGPAGLHEWLLLEWPPPNPAAFRAQVLENGMEKGAGWISPDGEIITMLILLADLAPGEMQELLLRINALIAQTPIGIHCHISGLPVLERAMDRILIDTAWRILPLLVLLALIFLYVIFRRLRDVLGPLLFAAVSQSILFGIMGYSGIRLNLVNIILAILIFVISLATAVHILVRCRSLEQQGMPPLTAVLATYRSKRQPVLWTGITTLAAFGSLVTGSIPPIRSLGLWSAIGIAIMTVLAFTFYPAVLAARNSKTGQQPVRPFEIWAQRWGRSLAHWAIRRRLPVLVGTTAAVVFALIGMSRFQIEDNLTRYFSPQNPVRTELERLQQHGVGVFTAELVLSYRGALPQATIEEQHGFQEPRAQQELARLSALARSHPLVYGAVSSGDLLEAAIRSILVEGKVNDNTRWLALGMMQSVPETRKILHALVTPDGQRARVSLSVPMLSFNQMQPLFRQIMAEAAGIFPGADIFVTGQYPLLLLAQEKLLWGLIVSLALTLICVMVVFYVILRSVRLTLFVVIPNLWPIVLVLGGMGWLKIPLDSVSIMTASIILGLAVDDTFHTLSHFLRLEPRCGPAQAIAATLERNAPAHILTTLILAAGFIACALSGFLPVARMGALSTVAITLALIGDLILIPALLAKSWLNPKSHY